jgi:hypothetical protein
MRWLLAVVLGFVVLGLFVANVALFGYLTWEKSEVSPTADTSCHRVDPQDSNYTPSKWRWIPPGRVCVDEGREFGQPTWRRVVVVIAFPLALAGSVSVLAWQIRRART